MVVGSHKDAVFYKRDGNGKSIGIGDCLSGFHLSCHEQDVLPDVKETDRELSYKGIDVVGLILTIVAEDMVVDLAEVNVVH